jgi:hypothetical protein
MPARVIVCPLCRSEHIEIVADIPAILLCKCRTRVTAFTITASTPIVRSETGGT